MAQFDPVAATAAYLAQLPPEVHAKAAAYTHGSEWITVWSAVVSVAVAWLVLRSGLLVGVRSRIESERPRPWLTTLTLALVYFVVEALLTLPSPAYIHHPLLVGPDGRRLAKRDGSIALADLRRDGIDPAQLAGDLRRGRFPVGIGFANA